MRRNIIRIVSFSLAVAVFSLGFSIKTYTSNKRYKLQLENGYSRSLDEFNAAVNNISLTLSKARFVTTPEQIGNIAAKLLTEAQISKNALAQLPSANELTTLNKFLSQVGNYAMSVSKELISGGAVTDKHTENIEKLSSAADKISQAVSNSRITYNNADYWASELDNKIDNSVDTESLATAIGDIEDGLSDYPTLVYDGPYSDHILEKEPEMLKGKETLSQEKAMEKAVDFAECNKESIAFDGEIEGKIPSYRFSGNGITVSVSKTGGYAVFMRKERAVKQSIISYEQAVEKAKRYLKRMNLLNFSETYYFTNEGICTVNFAFTDGETVCYTDLIKVGVAMDTGEIMFYEASGYISNHTDRAFETPTITPEEARNLISDKLSVNKVQLTLIPKSYSDEVRCYEFSCQSNDGQEILIYVNTIRPEIEEILILLKGDGGTLVK